MKQTTKQNQNTSKDPNQNLNQLEYNSISSNSFNHVCQAIYCELLPQMKKIDDSVLNNV